MDLSIVILNYKQQGLVKQCIKGIVTAQPQLSYEIIVVDNKSEDHTLEAVAKMYKDDPKQEVQQLLPIANPLKIPSIITIQANANNGFAAGNNLGIKKAKGKYVMILNPDIAIVPEALEKMMAYMDSNSDVGMIGPRLINPDGSVQYSCRRFPNFLTPVYRRTFFGKLSLAKSGVSKYLMKDFDHQKTQEVDWLFGACLLIKKSVLDKVGLLDERFFMYFEDLDLCRRVWQEKYKVVYYSDVELVHYHQRLSAQRGGLLGIFSKSGRIHIASGIKYFAKYLGVKLPPRV
ncbi:MAG: hypothetical protein CMI53_00375 [Parcubacteria group bacterium]|nr:hypothetical protein [Parcubacteria group bacterium]